MLLRRVNKRLTGGVIWRQIVKQRVRKGHPEAAPPRDPFYIHTPNTEAIVDGGKCLLTGA